MILIIKDERRTGSPLSLRVGSLYGDGERFLFSVNWPNVKLLFRMLSKINKKRALFLTH